MTVLTVKRLVDVLKKVPEKRFRIMDLAPQLVNKNGRPDVGKCMDMQADINLAVVEVNSYIHATREAYIAIISIGTDSRRRRAADEDIEVGEEDGI